MSFNKVCNGLLFRRWQYLATSSAGASSDARVHLSWRATDHEWVRLGSDEGLSELRVGENMHMRASTLESSSIRLCALDIA